MVILRRVLEVLGLDVVVLDLLVRVFPDVLAAHSLGAVCLCRQLSVVTSVDDDELVVVLSTHPFAD